MPTPVHTFSIPEIKAVCAITEGRHSSKALSKKKKACLSDRDLLHYDLVGTSGEAASAM